MNKPLLTALCGLLGCALSARAITLTFPGSEGVFVGPASEGIFTYDVFSGGLYHAATGGGNPVPHLEGLASVNGGVLRIVRNDIAGGLFTFEAADVAVHFFDGNNVTVEGFLLGVLQNTDTLLTQAGNENWVTRFSDNLDGVLIDQLRITLNASTSDDESRWEELDNVVLTTQTTVSVPDSGPTALLLLSSCIAICGLRWRIAR